MLQNTLPVFDELRSNEKFHVMHPTLKMPITRQDKNAGTVTASRKNVGLNLLSLRITKQSLVGDFKQQVIIY